MTASLAVDDVIQPFQLESAPVRGRLVRLGPAIDAILGRHDYPEPVSTMLGEMVVMNAAIAGAIKFDGICTLQIKSDGPVDMMVADLETPGTLRACARFDDAAVARAVREHDIKGAVPRLLGVGHLVFTVDQGDDTERYQGYVGLEGATLADCAHAYFRQSEQLQAGLRMAVARVDQGEADRHWRGSALMVQRLPEDIPRDDADPEDRWREALALAGSVSDEELTDPALTPDHLLYRLFHEPGVRVFRPVTLHEGCRCSRERIERVLRSFSAAAREEMRDEEGHIIVTCEFCARRYVFDEDDVARLGGAAGVAS